MTSAETTVTANCGHCGSSNVLRDGHGIWDGWMECNDCGYMTKAALRHHSRALLRDIKDFPMPSVYIEFFDKEAHEDLNWLSNLGWIRFDGTSRTYIITDNGKVALGVEG